MEQFGGTPITNLLVNRGQVQKLVAPLELFMAPKGSAAPWLRITALECHVLFEWPLISLIITLLGRPCSMVNIILILNFEWSLNQCFSRGGSRAFTFVPLYLCYRSIILVYGSPQSVVWVANYQTLGTTG